MELAPTMLGKFKAFIEYFQTAFQKGRINSHKFT